MSADDMLLGDEEYGAWDPDGDPLAYLPEDVDPDELAFGFHVETIPEEDEDGYIEIV